MQWCHVNFSFENPCCRGNQTFLFKDKIGCRLTKASNAETQLLGYIAWQWNRYIVPQNVFLVGKYDYAHGYVRRKPFHWCSVAINLFKRKNVQ